MPKNQPKFVNHTAPWGIHRAGATQKKNERDNIPPFSVLSNPTLSNLNIASKIDISKMQRRAPNGYVAPREEVQLAELHNGQGL